MEAQSVSSTYKF